jgi:hypothetical protein
MEHTGDERERLAEAGADDDEVRVYENSTCS